MRKQILPAPPRIGRTSRRRALLLAALALALPLSPRPVPAQDADRGGPPAFVPLESPAVAADLRSAKTLAAGEKWAAAAERYQQVIDGPLSDRLVPLDRNPDTLEQARERAQREMACEPSLREAHRARYGETAARLLAAALEGTDPRGLREAFARFPLTDGGARAGVLLAREALRRGRAEEALGILDRLGDLRAVDLATPDLLALRASAAAAAGDGELLAGVEAEGAALAASPAPGGGTMAGHFARCRASLRPAGPDGPRGPLALLWQWMPAEGDRTEPSGDDGFEFGRGDLPPPADHLVAVRDGVVYWTDPLRVIAIDLATGRPGARSLDVSAVVPSARPEEEHRGETFAPAADDTGIVAPLDLPGPTPSGRRAGTLNGFEGPGLRILARRGGEFESREMAGRFVFHGRPLLLGNRVFIAATETSDPTGNVVGDVRTHVMAFRRDDLAPIWDTFVSYGSGIRTSDNSPAGSLAHRHGRLYFATHTGLEACLDARGGGLLWAHRYRTPETPPTARLTRQVDRTMTPVLWYESPPVFSGDLVAFAPRDSYLIDFLYQRPLPGPGSEAGMVLREEYSRPRRDNADMHALWVLGGPAGKFFLAGQASGPEEAPLLLRDLDPLAQKQVPWRCPIMEPTIAGLPARTPAAIYLATEKALYRVPFPGRDGEVERLAVIPPREPGKERPSAGNIVVLADRILSVADDGILCFGPAPAVPPK